MEQILYAEIVLICILVESLLLYWLLRQETKSASDHWLIRVLLCFLVQNLASALAALFAQGEALAVMGLGTVYFLALTAGVFSFCGYAETEWRSGVFQERNNALWLGLLLALPVLVLLANPFTHHVFFTDEAGVYRQGALFYGLMAYLFAGAALCALRLLRHARGEGDQEKKRHMLLTSSFPLCIAVALLLSWLRVEAPIFCVCIMLELLCLYSGALNQQISIDQLTQVNNRRNLMAFLNYKVKNHEEQLFLFMIDVDNFKSINDSLGHLEGDHVLIHTSNVLKRACSSFRKRPYIARYGGDEFIVVLEGQAEDARRMQENIRDLLEKNGVPSLKKPLTLSIGQVQWAEGMDSRALVAAADQELYVLKRARGIRGKGQA